VFSDDIWRGGLATTATADYGVSVATGEAVEEGREGEGSGGGDSVLD
jgi:hypothetical protein